MRVLIFSLPPTIVAFNEDIYYLNTSVMLVGSLKKNTKLISAVGYQGGAYLWAEGETGMDRGWGGGGLPWAGAAQAGCWSHKCIWLCENQWHCALMTYAHRYVYYPSIEKLSHLENDSGLYWSYQFCDSGRSLGTAWGQFQVPWLGYQPQYLMH